MDDYSLEQFIDETCNESHLRVETYLGDGFVRLRTDEAERRQAIHDIRSSEDVIIELMRNARDAGARNIFIASSKNNDIRTFVVIDDGDGIPSSMHERIFESRVTTKLDSYHVDSWGLHGRGMALFAIKNNSDRSIVIDSGPSLGTSIHVSLQIGSIKEKTDQSSFPDFEMNAEKGFVLRGPKNIQRHVIEFALDCRDSVTVYFGSVSEIASALYHHGLRTTSSQERAFAKTLSSVPLVNRLAYAADEEDFARIAHALGLDMSTRNARRILDGTIDVRESLLQQFASRQASLRGSVSQLTKSQSDMPRIGLSDDPTVHINQSDLDDFGKDIARDFSDLAEKYYLDNNVDVTVCRLKESIRITIPIIKK